MTSLWLGILTAAYLLTLLLIPFSLLSRRKHPSSTFAWIFAIVFLPGLGPLVYAVFGMDGVRRRQRERERMPREIMPALESLGGFEAPSQEGLTPRQREIETVAARLTRMESTLGNAAELIPETPRAFERMEQAIREARDSIHIYHARTLTIDGCWSLVGSFNFDMRSLMLNFVLRRAAGAGTGGAIRA